MFSLASSCPQGKLQKSSSEQENVLDSQTHTTEGLTNSIDSNVPTDARLLNLKFELSQTHSCPILVYACLLLLF